MQGDLTQVVAVVLRQEGNRTENGFAAFYREVERWLSLELVLA